MWDAARGTLITTLTSGTGAISAVAWSPDGKQVLTGGRDSILRLWNAANGTLVTTLEGHSGAIFTVAWSRDGNQVLSGSQDNTAHLDRR